ncbi:hypothetical protein GFV15_00060 [Lactococcus lactis]|uniref:hypothetical protein n=1 Tax=Lactococcus lactis TaxID=1358 RepID=UPI001293A18E|nr:hypothetical protein [Lactococcus lactis]MQQ79387.1 hypothetical protein [Lactococcus lactis]
MKIKKRIWIRRKRLSDLYLQMDILRSKFGYPSNRAVTRIGHIYGILFRNSVHNVTVEEKDKYKKIESLIQEMERKNKNNM